MVAACLVLAASVSLVGCGRKAPPAMPQMAVEVKAVTVEPSSTITYADKVGEVRGSQEVEIRSRVNGILLTKHFVDGALVRRTAALLIDAARVPRAGRHRRAQLASAAANLARAQQDVERYEPLLAETPSAGRSTTTPSPPPSRPRRRWTPTGPRSPSAPRCRVRRGARAPDRPDRRIAGLRGALITAGKTLLATISATTRPG